MEKLLCKEKIVNTKNHGEEINQMLTNWFDERPNLNLK